jgi:aminoglycoside phosphotransferase (APT) family kinase protein
VKSLSGSGVRELEAHEAVQRYSSKPVAPRLLGSRSVNPDESYAFVEWVSPHRRWPWRASEFVNLVIENLAHIHSWDHVQFLDPLRSWQYDKELEQSARTTVDFYRGAFMSGVRPSARAMLPALSRVATAIIPIRRQLVARTGMAVLHGDAHPGNAVIRRAKHAHTALLLDWGRTRFGSPLEDIASWVHSVAFWEPEARRRHDTFLGTYLRARGKDPRLSPDFRDACYLAGACNALSGALRYHLSVVCNPERRPIDQYNSWRATADWMRIIRRADAVWRS